MAARPSGQHFAAFAEPCIELGALVGHRFHVRHHGAHVLLRLIARIGASRASTVTYLVPLFGVLWAYLAHGEPLTLNMAIAGALILGGVALNQQWGKASR